MDDNVFLNFVIWEGSQGWLGHVEEKKQDLLKFDPCMTRHRDQNNSPGVAVSSMLSPCTNVKWNVLTEMLLEIECLSK